MKIFYSSLLVMVAIGMVAAYLAVMIGIGAYADFAYKRIGFLMLIPLFIVGLPLTVWLDKREQKRTGIKKSIWRWHND